MNTRFTLFGALAILFAATPAFATCSSVAADVAGYDQDVRGRDVECFVGPCVPTERSRTMLRGSDRVRVHVHGCDQDVHALEYDCAEIGDVECFVGPCVPIERSRIMVRGSDYPVQVIVAPCP